MATNKHKRGGGNLEKIKPLTQHEWMQCNEFNRNLCNEFLENSTELSPKTIKSYTSNLKIWLNWVRLHCDDKRHVDIKSRDYLRFQNYLINLEHSSSDIKNKRAAISSLNNYIVVYYEDVYPTFRNFISRGIKSPEKSFVREKNPPTKAEMDMLFQKLEELEEWQKIAYLKFTFDTGCRRAEARQLLKSVVDSEPIVKTINVVNDEGLEEEKQSAYYITHKIRCKGKGKTGKVRTFKLNKGTMLALQKWLDVRGDDDCKYMFVTKHGGKINQVSESTFNQWSSGLFTKLLGRRFHPHILRESRATSLVVEDGKDIESARKLLGHESCETTQIYVVKDDEDDIDDLYIE